MTHEEAFLEAILEAPDDDAPRLIFADWLEDNAQPDRAELIRVQCELARRPAEQRGEDLRTQAIRLLHAHWDEWVGPLCELVGPRAARMGEGWLELGMHTEALQRFQRGFVESLTLEAGTFARRAEELYRLAPVRHLRVWGGGGVATALAMCPHLARLEHLEFADYYSAPLDANDVRALAASGHPRRLAWLSLGRNNVGDEGALALVKAPWLRRLRRLDIDDCGLGDVAALALASCPELGHLEALSLERNHFTRTGESALRDSPYLVGMRSLRM